MQRPCCEVTVISIAVDDQIPLSRLGNCLCCIILHAWESPAFWPQQLVQYDVIGGCHERLTVAISESKDFAPQYAERDQF